MKRIVSLFLVLVLALGSLCLSACKDEADIFDITKSSKPTKIITEVYYKGNDSLNGRYEMTIEGGNSIFNYSYQRYSTLEEGLDGHGRIRTLEGVVYFKDGKTSVDGDNWDSAAVTAVNINFDLRADYLTDATYTDDGNVVTATLTKENAKLALGTDLAAKESVSIEIKTNGTHLTFITLECETVSGANMKIVTSYSYNKISLEFPEA